MPKLTVIQMPDGKLKVVPVDLLGKEQDMHFIATHKNREFGKFDSIEEAEQFGGRIYMITNRVHKAGTSEEEILPVSTFIKEVPE